MRVPNRGTCFLILQKYNFPQRKKRHIVLIEKVAIYIGKRLKVKGKKIDLSLLSAGALLHDVDKGIVGAGEVHPKKGVELLKKLGYPEVARICETHTINSFLDPKTRLSTWEEKIVALSDKMVKDEIITVDERYKLWFRENLPREQDEILRKSYPLLKELEKEIFGMVGIKSEDLKNIKLTQLT